MMNEWYNTRTARFRGSVRIAVISCVFILYVLLMMVVGGFLWDIHWLLGFPIFLVLIGSFIAGLVYVIFDDDYYESDSERRSRRYR